MKNGVWSEMMVDATACVISHDGKWWFNDGSWWLMMVSGY